MSKGKYHIITFGCAMNKADSERIASLLDLVGLDPTDAEHDADLILINSCSVRQSAEDRIFGKLREYGRLKETKPDLIVAITGCLPGRDKDGKIRAKMPVADLYFPIREVTELPRRLMELRPDLVDSDGDIEADYLALSPKRDRRYHAFVTVQRGCDKYCTYCVVPYARGRETNRPIAEILTEVRGFADAGVTWIDLLGQAVNAYDVPDRENLSPGNPYRDGFAALLWEMNQIPGITRIGFTSPYPTHMTDEAIDALALPKMMKFLHLPVQSGSDEVLRRMNRRYTSARYLEIVAKVRQRCPDIALGTDIIVGFPGESEEDFVRTLELYRAADFDISYNAIYSPRSGTVAARFMEDDVHRVEKKRRWRQLHELMEATTLAKNQRFLGREVEVLVDEVRGGWCLGQSREMKLVRFRSDANLVGQTVLVKVTKPMTWMLEGEFQGLK